MKMDSNMTPEEQRSLRYHLGCIRGNSREIKKRLDSALGIAKKVGHRWEWRINNIRDDVIKLLADVEAEEKKMK
jgi:hypothetical protein